MMMTIAGNSFQNNSYPMSITQEANVKGLRKGKMLLVNLQSFLKKTIEMILKHNQSQKLGIMKEKR